MLKAAIYARYSSDEQKATSITDQIRDNTEYAEQNNMRIVKIYIDEAVSGKIDKRREFQQMLTDSKLGIFDAVIVWKMDRFGRNKDDIVINRYALKKNGVKLHYAKEYVPAGSEGVLIESVLEAYSQYYLDDMVQKLMRGKKGIALQCKYTGGTPALGYKVNANGNYEIDEYKAQAVKLIFTMYADGKSYTEIITTLNNKGYRTSKNKPFGKNSLHDILINEKYIGTYIYNQIASADENRKRNSHAYKDESDIIRVEDSIPAIIDKDTWKKVQDKMKENKKAPASNKAKVDYLLSGKIYCGECESAMCGTRKGANNLNPYYYYECSGKKRIRICNKKNIRKDFIENIVIEKTFDMLKDNDFLISIAKITYEVLQNKKEDNTPFIEKEIKSINKKIENLYVAIEDGMTEGIMDRIKNWETLKNNLEIDLQNEKLSLCNNITEEHIYDYLLQFCGGDIDDIEYKKRVIKILLNSVYIFDNEIIIIFNSTDIPEKKINYGDILVRMKGVEPPRRRR